MELKRQLRILRSPEASSECLKIMSKHDEKCACELHELKMKYEVEKLQTERELREERTQTVSCGESNFKLKMRQKHVAEFHELEIKERILNIYFLKERLRKN